MASHPNEGDGADDHDSIVYSYSVVTFLDLLGFRTFVEREPDPNKINEVLNKLRKNAKVPQDMAKPMALRCIFFSDSAIRVRQSGDCEGITSPGLQHELLMLAHIQASLIDDEIVVRGGITCGEVFLSSDRVFGPAYQEAYDLESKAALHPRIVVDRKLLERFIGYPEGGGDPRFAGAAEEVSELLSEDDDGKWFLDYLGTMSSEFDDRAEYWTFLRRHKKLIETRLVKTRENPPVHKKYVWLRGYHNKIVEAIDLDVLGEASPNKPSLLVAMTDEELPDGKK